MTSACVESPSSINSPIKCSCRKGFNGHRGLKTRQHSCRVIIGLSGETFEIQCNEEYLPTNELPPSVIDDQVPTMVGAKLQ